MVLPASEIRQVAAFARRSGETWFLAITNGPYERNVRIDLSSFLGKAPQPRGERPASFHATLLSDPGEAAALKIEHLTLAPSDSLSVDLRAGGGFVAMLIKIAGLCVARRATAPMPVSKRVQ
jgi:alpha-glucosidase